MVQTACPATAPGTAEVRPEVADIFRRFGPAYLRREHLPPQVAKVLRNIVRCRTAALGGHASVCETCGGKWLHYNSCFDRHCPTCQGPLAVVWTSECLERLVETHHFHLVTTCPEELQPLALANQALVYDLLLRATGETLLELAASRWKALPAITAVLHTWNRQMGYHPHVHCVVTGGGLSFDGSRWVTSKSDFLFPVKVVSKLVRGKVMHGLLRAYEAGQLRFVGTSAHLDDPHAFEALVDKLYATDWYSYAKPTFGNAEDILRYLALYTHRVAISSSRIVSVDDDAIVFLTKDGGTCRLHPDEFLRRFLLHVLPQGFRKIRYYGLSAPSNVNTRLRLAQRLAEAMNRRNRRAHRVDPLASGPTSRPTRPRPGDRCPACGIAVLVRQPLPLARAPPVPP